jgi:transposase InsO family protein
MSRVGNRYDNAVMESFFGTLKTECAAEPFATRAQAGTAYIEERNSKTLLNRSAVASAS